MKNLGRTALHALVVLAVVTLVKPILLQIHQRIWPEKRVVIALDGPVTYAQIYSVDGMVGGSSVPFIVDTGATTVRLSRSAAAKAGIDLSVLKYGVTSHSASGAYRTALITIPSIKIGGIEVKNVLTVIPEQETNSLNLLGMSFLKQIRFESDGRTLTLLQ